MPKGIADELKAAVRFAVKDLKAIAGAAPSGDLPREEQVRAAMFACLKRRGYTVHVDAYYPGSGDTCDLRVCPKTGREDSWVEIKLGYHVKGWQNQPSKLLGQWRDAVKKLKGLPKPRVRFLPPLWVL